MTRQDIAVPDDVPRYGSLDHWRGVAALSVMFFHSFGAIRGAGLPVHGSIAWLKWLADFGWFGVHLFFVISGFCIAANVCRLAKGGLGPWDFFRDRLLRIYPTYWAVCGVTLVVAMATMPLNHTSFAHNLPSGGLALLGNILLIEPYLKAPAFILVSWSLVFEIRFYLLVTLGFVLFRAGVGLPWLLVAAVALAVAGLCNLDHGVLFVLGFWPEFLCGGLVFLALAWKRAGWKLPAMILSLPVIFLVLGCFSLPTAERVGEMIGAGVFALLLFALHPLDATICGLRWLRWLSWVSGISYSLYLIHVPLEGRVVNLGLRWIASDSPAQIILEITGWLVALAGAWLFYEFCEAPLERWRHSQRRKTVSLKQQPVVAARKI